MDNFAIVQIKNSQYKISEGDVISIPRLDSKAGDKYKIDQVLLTALKDKIEIGKPFVEKSFVETEVLEHYRGEKVQSSTYKAKSRQRRKVGNRQELTKIKIIKIH